MTENDLIDEMNRRFVVDTRKGTISYKQLRKPVGNLTSRGVIKTTICRKEYYLHRLIWLYHYGSWPKSYLKRKDGDVRNNSINNLEDAGAW